MKGKIWFSEPTKGKEQKRDGDFSLEIISFFIGSISIAQSIVKYLSLSKWAVNSFDNSLILE